MKHKLHAVAAAALLFMLPSCYQMQPVSKETIPSAKVELAQNNYRVLATRVSAEDTGFSLFPIAGTAANALVKVGTLGLADAVFPAGIEITSPSESDAFKELYRKTGANQTGRATQFINVRKEYGGYNAFIFGRPKIRITADLIEFTH